MSSGASAVLFRRMPSELGILMSAPQAAPDAA